MTGHVLFGITKLITVAVQIHAASCRGQQHTLLHLLPAQIFQQKKKKGHCKVDLGKCSFVFVATTFTCIVEWRLLPYSSRHVL